MSIVKDYIIFFDKEIEIFHVFILTAFTGFRYLKSNTCSLLKILKMWTSKKNTFKNIHNPISQICHH